MTIAWKLTQEEEKLLPLVVKILSHRTKKEVFTNFKIRQTLGELGEDIQDSQIRKIVYNIRQRNLIPLLLANNEGYFRATTLEEVRKWIKTHKSKIIHMESSLESIQWQYEMEKDNLKKGNSELVGQMEIFDLID